jgi:dipeptidyl-peptidase-4
VRVEEIVPLTDSSKREPGMGMRQRTGIIKLVRMPVMASFTPTLTSTLPFAYAFDARTAKAILPILRIHGIAVQRLDAPATVTAQVFAVDTVMDRGRSETSRLMKDVGGRWKDAVTRTLPAGTYVVRAGQPYGLLAFYLLEPESEDGLAQWSFYDGILAARADFPVVRITRPAALHAHAAPAAPDPSPR